MSIAETRLGYNQFQSSPRPDLHLSLLDRVNVVVQREGGLYEAFVPIDLIYREDVPVDQEHVQELALSIKKESQHHNRTGQLSPVLLAEVADFGKLPIVDGFHRIPALALLEKEEVYATIRPDCTWEDVIDLRIVAATSHKSLKFSRIVEWVDDAWKRTPWAERLNVSGAFQIRFIPTSNGARSGINRDEAEEIRQWVDRKCEQWDLSAPYVHRYLQTARLADPELVKEARERKDGRKLEFITPAHLGAMVKYLPHNYPLQRIVADAATKNTLTIPQTKALALIVSKTASIEEARAVIESGSWRTIKFNSVSIKRTRHRDIDPSKPEEYADILTDKFLDEQIIIAELLIENAILTGGYIPRPTEQDVRLSTFLVTSGLDEVNENIQLNKKFKKTKHEWNSQEVEYLVARAFSLGPMLKGHLRRQLGIKEEDAEDIIQTTIEKFFIRVRDGRLSDVYSDPKHLSSLLVKMATFTAIDQLREISGRNGNKKPTLVSLDEKDENGLSLADRVGNKDEKVEIIDRGNIDFIKNILPILTERERRALILLGYFGLTHSDISQIIGTTEAAIHQTFQLIKKKIFKLTQSSDSQNQENF